MVPGANRTYLIRDRVWEGSAFPQDQLPGANRWLVSMRLYVRSSVNGYAYR